VPPVPAFGGGAAIPPAITAANLASAWQAVQNNNMANAMLAIPQIKNCGKPGVKQLR
jgi:hypothetical protein